MTNTEYSNGVFTQEQEELSTAVWDALIYRNKAKKINKEMSEYLEGLKW